VSVDKVALALITQHQIPADSFGFMTRNITLPKCQNHKSGDLNTKPAMKISFPWLLGGRGSLRCGYA
jgi:hypothetical protein